MADFELPKSMQSGLLEFAKLDDEQFEALAASLERAQPSLLRKKLVAAVRSDLSQPPEKLADVIRAIADVESLRSYLDESREEFIHGLENREWEKEGVTGQQISTMLERLKRVMSISSVSVTGKAYGVMTAHRNVYDSARTFTDIRPIFEDTEPSLPPTPVAALVTHTLRIQYHTSTGQLHNTHFALDDTDVKKLIKLLERALEKSRQVHASISRAGMQDLTEGME